MTCIAQTKEKLYLFILWCCASWMMAIFLHLSMQHRSHVLDIDLNPKIYSQFGFLLTDHWEHLPEKSEGKLK